MAEAENRGWMALARFPSRHDPLIGPHRHFSHWRRRPAVLLVVYDTKKRPTDLGWHLPGKGLAGFRFWDPCVFWENFFAFGKLVRLYKSGLYGDGRRGLVCVFWVQ